jgi:hypothetical protein
MSPFDADRTIAGLDDDGLVWEMLSGGEDLAPTYQPLLDLALGYQIRKGQLAADEPARVALVTTDNVSALSALSGALTAGILRINGRPARDNEPDYFRAIFITSSTLAATPPDYSDAIGMLRDFAPHVIIGIATSEFTGTIMPALEAQPQDIEPFYLLSPWHVEGSLLKSLEQRYPDIYSRMAGVNYAAAADPTIYDDYQNRFDAANPAVHGATGLENYYDAGYYLIYSAAAANAATPLSGSNLADGMQRLLSGPPTFGVGPDDLKRAFAALAAPASSIALNGAMGPPNFDPRSGSRHEPGSVFCIDGKGNLFTDVLRLDDNGELEGSFPCFDLIAP